MAINRLLLECTICGQSVVIARYAAGDDVWSPARTPATEYADFLQTHGQHDGILHVVLSGENTERLDLARVQALQDALHEYGRHHHGCLIVPCSCGLADLLAFGPDTRA